MTHYGIVGPGAIGLLWAVKLNRHNRVSLWGRDGARELSLVFADNEHPPASYSFGLCEQVPDVALVTTKTYDTVSALNDAFTRWGKVPAAIVLFQNGIGCQEEVQKRFNQVPLLAVSTTEGANRRDDGTLVHAGSGLTRLGGLNVSGSARAATVCADFRAAGFDVRVESDIRVALWEKLAINAGINAFTVILDCANGALPGDPFFETYLPSLCREVARVSEASGYPADAASIEERVRAVSLGTAKNISSTLQDVRAGRRTEIRAINGAVISAGEALGIPTPVNAMLVRAVEA